VKTTIHGYTYIDGAEGWWGHLSVGDSVARVTVTWHTHTRRSMINYEWSQVKSLPHSTTTQDATERRSHTSNLWLKCSLTSDCLFASERHATTNWHWMYRSPTSNFALHLLTLDYSKSLSSYCLCLWKSMTYVVIKQALASHSRTQHSEPRQTMQQNSSPVSFARCVVYQCIGVAIYRPNTAGDMTPQATTHLEHDIQLTRATRLHARPHDSDQALHDTFRNANVWLKYAETQKQVT